MSSLPFGSLSPFKPRSFVPLDADLGDWGQIEPLFQSLEHKLAAADTASLLDRWLINWSELTAALDEEGTRRYIAMTCQTDDTEIEKAYLFFIEQIEPKLKPWQFRLSQALVGHPLSAQLPHPR